MRAVPDAASAMEQVGDLPDGLVIDIGLPDVDGYSVAREARLHPELKDTMIIAVTGYGRERDIAASRAAGADHHVTKPIDLDHVLGLIGQRPR